MGITKQDMATALVAMAHTTQRDPQVDAMATYMLGEYAGASDKDKNELLTKMREALNTQALQIQATIKCIELEFRSEPSEAQHND